MVVRLLVLTALLLTTGCATSPPSDVNNICSIFKEKNGWYEDAKESRDRWGCPVTVMMAIMHQESRFVAKAKPPRRKIFGFIPGPRPSSAYGYSQAKTSTWDWYEKSSGNYGADRDDFGDALDFVGWYCRTSNKQNSIPTNDAFRQYLAYHEGHGGYRNKTYRDKEWLVKVARKVDAKAKNYNQQLLGCRESLETKPWWKVW